MQHFKASLCASAIGGLAIILGAHAAEARDFTYAGWGGGLQDAQRKAYLDRLAKTLGAPVKEDVYLGGWAKFQTMKDSKDVVWDVINVESPELQRGCDEGVFAKIDYARIGTPQSGFVPGGATDCGIGSYVWAFALAYNTDQLKSAPTSLADLWDVKTWPGRRGLRKGPHFNLELALLADGLAPADVYKTLGTKEGVDRAFKKLDEIKPQVVWWESPAQTIELLGSNNVSMVIAPNARISDAARAGKPFKMVFKPGMVGTDFWVVMKDSPNTDGAYQFLKIVADPQKQSAFSTGFAYAPTLKAAGALLPASVIPSLPVGEAVANALDLSGPDSNQFWSDNGDEINERWNNWLTR